LINFTHLLFFSYPSLWKIYYFTTMSRKIVNKKQKNSNKYCITNNRFYPKNYKVIFTMFSCMIMCHKI
jgi:hypothetical protein